MAICPKCQNVSRAETTIQEDVAEVADFLFGIGSGACSRCHGTGKSWHPAVTLGADLDDCQKCRGTGNCNRCGGSGTIEDPYEMPREDVDVRTQSPRSSSLDDLSSYQGTSEDQTSESNGSFSAAGCLSMFGGLCLLAGVLATVGGTPKAGSMVVVGVLTLVAAGAVHFVSESVLPEFPIIEKTFAAGFFGYVIVGIGGCVARTYPDAAAAGGLSAGLRSFVTEAFVGALLGSCIVIATSGRAGLLVAAGILSIAAIAGLAMMGRVSESPWVRASPNQRTTKARVTAPNLNLRSGPGATKPVVATLPRNSQVILLGEQQDIDGTAWVRVRSNNQNGWVSAKHLGALE